MRTVKMDHEQMQAAQKKYDERVDGLLASDQKKAWKEGGYSRAFGRRGSGRAMVLSTRGSGDGGGASIFISTDISEGSEPDEKK